MVEIRDRRGRGRGPGAGAGAFWSRIQPPPPLILSQAILALCFYLFPLHFSWLFPFNDLRDTYCVFSLQIELYWKEKHTSEHRFNASTRLWNTPLKSSCTRLLKFTRKTPKHRNTLAHQREWGAFRRVRANTQNDSHVILKKKQIYLDFQFPILSRKSDIYNHTVTARQTSKRSFRIKKKEKRKKRLFLVPNQTFYINLQVLKQSYHWELRLRWTY